MNIIQKLIEYIKSTYQFIYNNYNYKQIFLVLLVFFTIYLVEFMTKFNYGTIMPIMPGMPTIQPPQSNIKEKLSKKIKPKSVKNINKSKK